MIHSLDVLDLVEAQVEGCKFGQSIKALDVCNEVVVEVEVCEGGGEVWWELGFLDLILA